MSRKIFRYSGIFIVFIISLFILSKSFLYEEQLEVAVTVDDIPLVAFGPVQSKQVMSQIIDHLDQSNAPAVGFVITQNVNSESIQQLYDFQKSGHILGNHTHSHPNLKDVNADEYMRDTALADKNLLPFFPEQKFFRFPYMAMATGEKKKAVLEYLSKNQYVYAPVTIDSKDFKFNLEFSETMAFNPNDPGFQALKKRYLDFIQEKIIKREIQDKWFSLSYKSKKQTLLVHANPLNGYVLGEVLELFDARGYKFIAGQDAEWG